MLLEVLPVVAAPLGLCCGKKIQTKDAINLCGTHFSATQPIRANPSIAGASRQGAFFAPVAPGSWPAELIMQLVVEPLLFVVYYWACLFCTEERLWAIFAKRPLHTLRTSWFGSRHFAVAYAVAILLFGVALPRSCEAMRRACLADHQCARRLARDAYGWYDADDGQWRAYRGSCLLYTSPSPRDGLLSRMPSSA